MIVLAISTPAIVTNRVYVLATNEPLYAIYAVDSRTTLFLRFNISWRLFLPENPTGELLAYVNSQTHSNWILFSSNTSIGGVLDEGFDAKLVWTFTLPSQFRNGASFVQSNQQGYTWIYSPRSISSLLLLINIQTGELKCQIDVTKLFPSSSMVISSNVYSYGIPNDDNSGALILTAYDIKTNLNYLIALRPHCSQPNLYWKFLLPQMVFANSTITPFQVFRISDKQNLLILPNSSGILALQFLT